LKAKPFSYNNNSSYNDTSSLSSITGWNQAFEDHLASLGVSGVPARVIAVDRGGAWVLSLQDLSRLASTNTTRQMWEESLRWVSFAPLSQEYARLLSPPIPLVGDWLTIQEGTRQAPTHIEAILPRRSCLLRQASGTRTEAQGVAANVDTIAVVTALGEDLSLPRLERYLIAIWESGASPAIILNKIDRDPDEASRLLAKIEKVSPNVPLYPISAIEGVGLSAFYKDQRQGMTIAFIGSSGVGKSTLLNAYVEDADQRVQITRKKDEQGQHTTTRREIFLDQQGLWWIDTPGMREFSPWQASEDALSQAFSDISAYADRCRFRDCQHNQEPGCAVQEAIADGLLDAKRLRRHQALLREAAYQQERVDEQANMKKKEKWKTLTKGMKERQKITRQLGLKSW
jgi:ribosome biogenesis GTPase